MSEARISRTGLLQIGTQRRILWMVLFTARAIVPLLNFTRGRVCWLAQDIDGIRTKEDRFIQDRKYWMQSKNMTAICSAMTVRFDSYSYYQFTGKDGRNHRVLSMGSSLSPSTFASFGKERFDKEAAEYAEFWEDVAHGNVWSIEQRYSQKEIRQKLTDAGIQNGFFTVTVGNRSQSYYLSANEDGMTLYSKEAYDKRYNALVSGKTFQLDKFQPGQTVTVGGKEYVLNEHKGIDIEYGAEV